ncbi:Cysteine-rich receptor-like protein kinase 25 [Morus notabilis]|uniref:Cysteine-rich receptor-like protein kinase 25 n=1 Tax=Morus notabilis TaxID=981085 RepID=W9REI1_9ROSA|nr:Cysteine-rich receptor-like protein kinase 25 [Morus notabilis]
MASSSLLYLAFAFINHISLLAACQDYFCTSPANYTSNSIHEANLNTTLSSLHAKSLLPNGFHNASTGMGRDRVYGLFQCRGDISPDFARDVSKPARKQLKDSVYSKSISPLLVQPALRSLVEGLVLRALSSGKLFATGKFDNLSFLGTVYGLVQCTLDITSKECRQCQSIPIEDTTACCYGRQGGRILKPSCSIRYGRVPFNKSRPAPLAAPSSFGIGENLSTGKEEISKGILAIFLTFVSVLLVSALLGCLFGVQRSRKKSYHATVKEKAATQFAKAPSSLKFDLDTIKTATNHFSCDNMIGEGGFGRVYKGKLKNGQVIAVKRLAIGSRQGAEEFLNEVTLLAKLQDCNLVRLFGFCLEREEKILIYEFVPNKSLDYFLFG